MDPQAQRSSQRYPTGTGKLRVKNTRKGQKALTRRLQPFASGQRAGALNTRERDNPAIKEGKEQVYILRGRETMRHGATH